MLGTSGWITVTEGSERRKNYCRLQSHGVIKQCCAVNSPKWNILERNFLRFISVTVLMNNPINLKKADCISATKRPVAPAGPVRRPVRGDQCRPVPQAESSSRCFGPRHIALLPSATGSGGPFPVIEFQFSTEITLFPDGRMKSEKI